MTQPQPAQGNGQVLTAAALALALIAVEAKVRQDTEDAVSAAYTAIAVAAIIVASTAPGTVIVGVALLSIAAMHRAIVDNLGKAREQVEARVSSGYVAAAELARTHLFTELHDPRYQPPATAPNLGSTLATLQADIDLMFGHAQTQLQHDIAAAFDGVQGDNPTPARVVAIHQAITAGAVTLQNRAANAATTAVHRGSTDMHQSLYADYQTQTGTPGLMKQWVTTSAQPCGMCEALDGTLVGVNGEFDHNATTVDADLRAVWKNLLGPPRHPNCRCTLQLVTT